MEEKTVVSVLVITYNQARFITQALESVLEQKTTFPIEVLVGNDCSTDESADVIAQFGGDLRVQIIQRSHNLGATENLYDLQIRAKGKYLAYLEGDDYWNDPYKLQRQVDFLESHEEFIGCTHRCEIVDENGNPYKRQRLSWVCQKRIYTLKDFKGLMLPGHGNAMVHRNIFRGSQWKYKELITLHSLIADRSLVILLASIGPIFRFDECMSCYRIVRGGERTNATAVAYSENADRVWDDYMYTKALEHYAQEELRVDGGFEHHKKELFVSAVFRALRQPTTESWTVVKKIWNEGNRLAYLTYFPFGFLKKMWDKLSRRYV